MAGIAFLPWEKWLAELLHPAYVRFRRWFFERKKQQWLLRSEGWPQAEGIVNSIQWDSSLSREGLRYSYSPEQGNFSGFSWRWFDASIPVEVRSGDRVLLRYNPEDPDESVVLECRLVNSSALSVPSVMKRF
jgi:hypothetical protein